MTKRVIKNISALKKAQPQPLNNVRDIIIYLPSGGVRSFKGIIQKAAYYPRGNMFLFYYRAPRKVPSISIYSRYNVSVIYDHHVRHFEDTEVVNHARYSVTTSNPLYVVVFDTRPSA